METLSDILLNACIEGASDVHIGNGTVGFRIMGDMQKKEQYDHIPGQEIQFVKELLGDGGSGNFDDLQDKNLAYETKEGTRFRINIARTMKRFKIVARRINDKVPTFEEIGLDPKLIIPNLSKSQGLILVTGPTGSGKSTTLSAMIEYINQHESSNIVTLEDPVECIYNPSKSFITQREVGIDTTYEDGLNNVLRQDPDVILIGEMRTNESFLAGLKAAETGHLVFSTMHTKSAPETISRVAEMFRADQDSVLSMFANSITMIISQSLVRSASGDKMILVPEIFIPNTATRNNIKDNKTKDLQAAMETSPNLSKLNSVKNLLNKRLITKASAESLLSEEELKNLNK